MKIVQRIPWAGALVLAGVLGLSSCDGAATDGAGHGTVQELDAERRKVTLDHGDIPGVMKGMTMTFELGPDVDLAGIEPGTEVDFRIKEESGVYTVTEIRRSGS